MSHVHIYKHIPPPLCLQLHHEKKKQEQLRGQWKHTPHINMHHANTFGRVNVAPPCQSIYQEDRHSLQHWGHVEGKQEDRHSLQLWCHGEGKQEDRHSLQLWCHGEGKSGGSCLTCAQISHVYKHEHWPHHLQVYSVPGSCPRQNNKDTLDRLVKNPLTD